MKRIVLLFCALALFGATIAAQTNGNSTTSNVSAAKPKAFRPNKSQITAAQEKLKGSGGYSGAVDGKYNDDFRASIKSYQEANGLEKNGKLDEATLLKMGIELSDSQKGINSGKSESDSSPKSPTFRANRQQISEAQKMLKSKGTYSGEPTGKYDDDLRAAIKTFQSENGLTKSGTLNRSTLEKMGIELTDAQQAIAAKPGEAASSSKETSSDTPKRGPIFRATKDQINEVQRMLKSKGLYKGEETGQLNDDTRAAIKEWQKANGVKETGTLNKETLEKMGVELTDKQKAM